MAAVRTPPEEAHGGASTQKSLKEQLPLTTMFLFDVWTTPVPRVCPCPSAVTTAGR